MAQDEQQQQHQRSRGYAVLITNQNFTFMPKDSTREGGGVDDKNLQYIFGTKLKFNLLEQRTYVDVDTNQFDDHLMHEDGSESIDKSKCHCLICKIQTLDHSDSECFVLTISTHGAQVDGDQEICFSDSLSYSGEITLSRLIETLNDDNCKTLRGKPRIIILQVCRHDPYVRKERQDEEWHDKGYTLNVSSKDNGHIPIENMRIGGGDASTSNHPDAETNINAGGNASRSNRPDAETNINAGDDASRSNHPDAETNINTGVDASRSNHPNAETNINAGGDASRSNHPDAETNINYVSDASRSNHPDAETNVNAGCNSRHSQDSKQNNKQDNKQVTKEIKEPGIGGTELFDFEITAPQYNLPQNFMVVFPTVSGKKAVHDFKEGSWLIDELRKVVEDFDFERNPEMNFLSMLTHAAGNVAQNYESAKGTKCAVCIEHRLLQPIIFKDIKDTTPNLTKPAL